MFEEQLSSEMDQYEYESTIADVVFYIKQRGWDNVLSDIVHARNLGFEYDDQADKELQDSPF